MQGFNPTPLAVLAGVLALFAIVLAVTFLVTRGSRRTVDSENSTQRKQHPEGYWTSLGMSLGLVCGLPLGLLFGIVTDNFALGIALGPGMGLTLGLAIGSGLEQRYRDQLRPLTAEEKRLRVLAVRFGLASLALGVLVLLVVLAAS